MHLLHLGLTNATRNMARSLMTILAMAIATVMMAASATLSQGYTPYRSVPYRLFLGGDLLVYPAWTWPSEKDLAGVEPGRLRLVSLPETFGSPLRYFHPDYYSTGYLCAAPSEPPRYSMFDSEEQSRRVTSGALENPNVEAVSPYVALPIVEGGWAPGVAPVGDPSPDIELGGAFLRSCPPALMAESGTSTPRALQPSSPTGVGIPAGRWLYGDEQGLVALVNARGLAGNGRTLGPEAAGRTIRVSVPRIARDDGPEPGPWARYDGAGANLTFDLTVVGLYELPTRVLHYNIGRTDFYEQLYWEAPEVLIPPRTMDRLLTMAGRSDTDPAPVGALLVSLKDQSIAERTADELRGVLEPFSVVSVARQADYGLSRVLPEPIYECPLYVRSVPSSALQPVIPAQAQGLLGVVLFVLGGLVAAGNATLVVLGRQTEFAVLKAIGLMNWEIATVVVTEVLCLSMVGFVVGFSAAVIVSLPMLLSSGVGPGQIIGIFADRLAVVAPLMTATAVLFSIFPAIRVLRVTVMEAMRGDV